MLKPIMSFILEVPLTIWFFRHFEDAGKSGHRVLPGYLAFFLLLPLYLIRSQIPFGYFIRIPYRWFVYFIILRLTTKEDLAARLHISLSASFLLTVSQLFAGVIRMLGMEAFYLRLFHIAVLSDFMAALTENVLLFLILAGFLHFVPVERFRGIAVSQVTAYLACTLGGIITRTYILELYNSGIRPSAYIFLLSVFFTAVLYVCIVMTERYYYLEMDSLQAEQLVRSSEYELRALNQKMENEQRVRSIYHDMKNHYSALDALLENGETEKARKYLEELNRSLTRKKAAVQTGNPLLDQLMAEKVSRAKEAGIDVEVSLDYSQCGFISHVDTVIIFSNAMDNALEAVSASKKEPRFIKVNGSVRAGCFLGVISNSYDGGVRFSGGLPVTTKKDAINHGYGLKNIRNALEKYEGELNAAAEEDVFSLYITIPLKDQEEAEG